jgi:hypothetical protein
VGDEHLASSPPLTAKQILTLGSDRLDQSLSA